MAIGPLSLSTIFSPATKRVTFITLKSVLFSLLCNINSFDVTLLGKTKAIVGSANRESGSENSWLLRSFSFW